MNLSPGKSARSHFGVILQQSFWRTMSRIPQKREPSEWPAINNHSIFAFSKRMEGQSLLMAKGTQICLAMKFFLKKNFRKWDLRDLVAGGWCITPFKHMQCNLYSEKSLNRMVGWWLQNLVLQFSDFTPKEFFLRHLKECHSSSYPFPWFGCPGANAHSIPKYLKGSKFSNMFRQVFFLHQKLIA